jgi:hypothetical protein
MRAYVAFHVSGEMYGDAFNHSAVSESDRKEFSSSLNMHNDTTKIAAVPEPSSVVIALTAVASGLGLRRRSRGIKSAAARP